MRIKRIALPLALGSLALAAGGGEAVAEHAHPESASPTRVALVPAYDQCTTPNATHAPPVSKPSCAPPAQSSDYLTVGARDANGNDAKSTGFVELRVFYCPQCAAPFNEEVFITAQITDVRNKGDLSDYTGGLRAIVTLRITDHLNKGRAGDLEAGTVQEYPLRFTVACTATDDATVGSTCETYTSANALVPGIVRQDAKAIWQLGQVRLFDGGADGRASTAADNTLFAIQGIFLP
jgi:hypothetical protein